MNIVWILGGLGNQMFQYAFYLSLKSRSSTKMDLSFFENYDLHNGYELDAVFGIEASKSSKFENAMYGSSSNTILSRVLSNCFRNKRYTEQIFSNYDPSILENCNLHYKYYQGYWQSWKYFTSVQSLVRKSFQFPDFQNKFNLELLDIIVRKKCFSIHVRRGDYVDHFLHGNICDDKYYDNAIDYVDSRFSDVVYLVFSNDIKWCRNRFRGDRFLFVDCNLGQHSFNDMHLMSLCAGNIIANSSFSWWGAYLTYENHLKDLIISPKRWYNNIEINMENLILPEWIQL